MVAARPRGLLDAALGPCDAAVDVTWPSLVGRTPAAVLQDETAGRQRRARVVGVADGSELSALDELRRERAHDTAGRVGEDGVDGIEAHEVVERADRRRDQRDATGLVRGERVARGHPFAAHRLRTVRTRLLSRGDARDEEAR